MSVMDVVNELETGDVVRGNAPLFKGLNDEPSEWEVTAVIDVGDGVRQLTVTARWHGIRLGEYIITTGKGAPTIREATV